MTVRIAMWSGPRNLSTALMRSFAGRGDCVVVDEPLYAAYLATTGLQHPMREAILASQPTDWREAVAELLAPVDARVQFQKHMVHHLLPEVGRDWMGAVRHAFLIRDPAAVVASYARQRSAPTPEDLGFPQLAEVFRFVTEELGQPPVVVDATDLRADAPGVLRALCAALGIQWTERMLSWPAGPHPGEGVWADHWYAAVRRSTGFEPPRETTPEVPAHLQELAVAGRRSYELLAEHRLPRGG